MELANNEKEILAQLASTWAPKNEMAISLGMSLELFVTELQDSTSDIYEIVHRERILSKRKVLKSVFDMAQAGSSVAQQIALKIIEKEEIENELDT